MGVSVMVLILKDKLELPEKERIDQGRDRRASRGKKGHRDGPILHLRSFIVP